MIHSRKSILFLIFILWQFLLNYNKVFCSSYIEDTPITYKFDKEEGNFKYTFNEMPHIFNASIEDVVSNDTNSEIISNNLKYQCQIVPSKLVVLNNLTISQSLENEMADIYIIGPFIYYIANDLSIEIYKFSLDNNQNFSKDIQINVKKIETNNILGLYSQTLNQTGKEFVILAYSYSIFQILTENLIYSFDMLNDGSLNYTKNFINDYPISSWKLYFAKSLYLYIVFKNEEDTIYKYCASKQGLILRNKWNFDRNISYFCPEKDKIIVLDEDGYEMIVNQTQNTIFNSSNKFVFPTDLQISEKMITIVSKTGNLTTLEEYILNGTIALRNNHISFPKNLKYFLKTDNYRTIIADEEEFFIYYHSVPRVLQPDLRQSSLHIIRPNIKDLDVINTNSTQTAMLLRYNRSFEILLIGDSPSYFSCNIVERESFNVETKLSTTFCPVNNSDFKIKGYCTHKKKFILKYEEDYEQIWPIIILVVVTLTIGLLIFYGVQSKKSSKSQRVPPILKEIRNEIIDTQRDALNDDEKDDKKNSCAFNEFLKAVQKEKLNADKNQIHLNFNSQNLDLKQEIKKNSLILSPSDLDEFS